MPDIPNFKPFPLLTGCHFQTIIASLLLFNIKPKSKTEYVEVSCGDRLAMEVYVPKTWKETDVTVVMIHGYSGSHRSPYLIRMTKKLAKLGIRAISLNMRGCGSGKGHAKKLYHGGLSEDVLSALRVIKQKTPHSPIVLLGFSIGGNIILKLAGELESHANKLVSRVIAVNPPMDLHDSVKRLSLKCSRFYHRMFFQYLRSEIEYRKSRYKALREIKIPKKTSIYELDAKFTAPEWGFSDVDEYYKDSSSKYYIHKISVPCNILLSKDDPIVDSESLQDVDVPSNVEVMTTEEGGHLGFLGRPTKRFGFYWMDALLLEWIQINIDSDEF
ncbi:MAG: alpha/beta fold hydrolase [Simkaniaceae bacterium]|nr:alpha/beta fold hydrolase [Simkaniaceae bacterium]